MSSNTSNWFTFGDLKVGETFVFYNPFIQAKPDFEQEHMTKISPRRYRDGRGVVFHTASKTGVCRIIDTSFLRKENSLYF